MNKTLQSFQVDFNWYGGKVAKPGLFTDSDPAEYVRYSKDLGCNNIWTYATSFNGYAWYDSNIAPKNPGLKRNFTAETTDLAHEAGMTAFAYVCLADNAYWIEKKPALARVDEPMFRMPLAGWYVDYVGGIIDEVLERVPQLDGIAIDWFRGASILQRSEWTEGEKALYLELMGEKVVPGKTTLYEIVEYERRSIASAWEKLSPIIHGRGKKIWTNHPFDKVFDPVWQGQKLLREVDYILNESPDFSLLDWILSQKGTHTTVVQNLCGWTEHDNKDLDTILDKGLGWFGFAAADPETCLPSKRISQINEKNIQIIRQLYGNHGNRIHFPSFGK